MALASQTVTLLRAARELVRGLPADAVLLLTETALDWDAVLEHLGGCRLLVAAQDGALTQRLKEHPGLTVLDIDPGPTPTQERMSLALLEAVRTEKIQSGADVIALYNGIDVGEDKAEQIDSLSVIHLGEHLERLSSQDLRRLDTQVPLETLRAVVDVATEIGSEGREGKPVGTLFVVGDTKRVLSMSHSLLFNPFRGYSEEDRDIRHRRVREQIKELAQLDGAFIVRRDGVVVASSMYIDALAEGVTLSKGLGARHWAAAAITRKTTAVAVAVSQSSGTVRVFLHGEVVLRIEPLARPMVFGHFRMEAQEGDGLNGAGRSASAPERTAP
jgi:DNA integrity scanning protein DisA with diadenylate cyclase activity